MVISGHRHPRIPPTPTVLVADDDVGCRRSVQEALETAGFVTVPAETGLEAVEVVKRDVIHLGVFDLHMPEMSGIDAIRALRHDAILLPVIVMTSDQSEDVQARAISEGAARLLMKPIDLLVIRQTVREVLDGADRS